MIIVIKGGIGNDICLAILQELTHDQRDEMYAKLQLIMLAATWSQVNTAAGSCSSNYVQD